MAHPSVGAILLTGFSYDLIIADGLQWNTVDRCIAVSGIPNLSPTGTVFTSM